MAQQINESAWLLHTRKYTDSRILVDLLSEHGSLISGVYRVPVKSRAPQMFRLLNVSRKGNHELKQITAIEQSVEAGSQAATLTGNALYCGLYLNELLVRLLMRDESHSNIFQAYTQAVAMLYAGAELEPALRQFEFCLLDDLGYGLDFTTDVDGQAIAYNLEHVYEFKMDEGFVRCLSNSHANRISGKVLGYLAAGDFSDPAARRTAKRLCRECIDSLLGGRTLKSRELFRAE